MMKLSQQSLRMVLVGLLGAGLLMWLLWPPANASDPDTANDAQVEATGAQSVDPSELVKGSDQAQRTEVQAEQAPSSLGAGQEQGPGLSLQGPMIRFQVIRASSNEPLADYPVKVLIPSGSAFEVNSTTTDADGRGEFSVPAGTPVRVIAGPPSAFQAVFSWKSAADANGIYADAVAFVDALARDQVVDLILQLDPPDTRRWFLAVDGESGLPLAGAQARLEQVDPILSSEDGLLGVPEPPTRSSRVIEFEHPDYASIRFEYYEGGPSEQAPKRVEFFRSASLRVSLSQAGQPMPKGQRVLVYESYVFGLPNLEGRFQESKLLASASTDEEGAALLEPLPGERDLVVVLPIDRYQQLVSEIIHLNPSEQGSLEWELGVQRTIRGWVFDEHGAPMAKQMVTLTDGRTSQPGDGGLSVWYELAKVQSDSAGEFRFERVYPGDYWVSSVSGESDQGEMTTSVLVTVPFDSDPAPIELRHQAGLPFRCTLVDQEGRGIEGLTLGVFERETDLDGSGKSSADGSVEIGTWPVGSRVSLFVYAGGYTLANETELTIEAGMNPTVVCLAAASISGRAIAPGLAQAQAWKIRVSNDQGYLQLAWSGSEGAFFADGLAAGRYQVFALADGGWFGQSQAFDLNPGDKLEDIEITVERTAEWTVESQAEIGLRGAILKNGIKAESIDLPAQGRVQVPIPTGEFTLEFYPYGELVACWSKQFIGVAGQNDTVKVALDGD